MAQADITNEAEVAAMMSLIEREFGHLRRADSERQRRSGSGQAGRLRHDAQLDRADERGPRSGASFCEMAARIVFVTSHWAHFYGTKPVMPVYEPVAKSKRAGEDALRDYAAELAGSGISLVVVSGDAIEGTITPRLLERKSRGHFDPPPAEKRTLPTVDEFAEAIAEATVDCNLLNGQTIFVGSTEF